MHRGYLTNGLKIDISIQHTNVSLNEYLSVFVGKIPYNLCSKAYIHRSFKGIDESTGVVISELKANPPFYKSRRHFVSYYIHLYSSIKSDDRLL